MNKSDVAAYFDRMAPDWDAHMVTDDAKLRLILDTAGVQCGSTVLDVACGTGVLFPYYLRRGVAHLTGVDLSAEMARIAAGKLHDPRVEVLCADIETLEVFRTFDCCVVYNAFPHFADPGALLARLALWVRPGGRLTVAHGMSLEALHRHHAGSARAVSREMLPPQELAALAEPWFAVDVQCADAEKYILSGVRR